MDKATGENPVLHLTSSLSSSSNLLQTADGRSPCLKSCRPSVPPHHEEELPMATKQLKTEVGTEEEKKGLDNQTCK